MESPNFTQHGKIEAQKTMEQMYRELMQMKPTKGKCPNCKQEINITL